MAAAEEERFTRRKFDNAFPENAIRFCLDQAGVTAAGIGAVGFGFDPRRRIAAKLAHVVRFFPGSLHLVRTRYPLAQKMRGIAGELRRAFGYRGPVLHLNHHLCHAASAFFASGFDAAAVLTIDGVGDWEAAWWGIGQGKRIRQTGRVDWPRSLGHIYAAFTEYLGFAPFSDEYKVMGLAPYGEPRYLAELQRMFWPVHGGYDVNLDFFEFQYGRKPRFSRRLVQLLGPPLKDPGSDPPQHFKDIAASLQKNLEDVIIHLARHVVSTTGMRRLCLAGGVAMNSVANGRLITDRIADAIYVPSSASDAGVALGAAYLAANRTGALEGDTAVDTALLGPEYDDSRIEEALIAGGLPARRVDDPAMVAAELLSSGKVVGWFQGRMEFGQRALGSRSILADPRRAEMKAIINAKVKFREAFRPFAPSVLEESVADYFVAPQSSPFMTEVYPVRPEKRAVIPAVTHVDGSARIQTVARRTNPLYWRLIDEFGRRTGVPVLLNTSFNIKGQPIVNTPEEAVETFRMADLDAMVCGHFVVEK